MFYRTCAAALALVGVQCAQAADLTVPDHSHVAAYDWSGFYAGIHGGGTFTAEFDNNVPVNPGPFGDAGGPMGGVQAGFNWQTGQWVLGVEGDFSVIDLRARSATRTFDEDFMATLRARVGFAWDRMWLYATGGVAVTNVEASLIGVATDDDWAWGPAAGAGAEIGFGERWSFKGEYLFTHVPEQTLSTGAPPTIGGSDNHTVRGGLNIHF